MSEHNHDKDFLKQFGTNTAQKLQKKADKLKDKKVISALLKADISGLSRKKASNKLNNIVDEILDHDF